MHTYKKPEGDLKELLLVEPKHFGSPVRVCDSPAAQRSGFQAHHSPLTCSSIQPASPGYSPGGSTAPR